MSEPRILFIVEGKREKNLYKKLAEKMGLSVKIFSVCANIHMLYEAMKKEDFMLNVDDFLLTLNGVDEKDKKMIEKERPFTYIYLIFDLDLQHYDVSKRENVEYGLSQVIEMLEKFNDESDPTIGKMYINYPMIESYRDCESFFDNGYKEKEVCLGDVTKYKETVGERGIKLNLSKYTFENFIQLTRMNIYKANYIVNGTFEKIEYGKYVKDLDQKQILSAQNINILENSLIKVLHSGYFFMVDYRGDNNDFYSDNFHK